MNGPYGRSPSVPSVVRGLPAAHLAVLGRYSDVRPVPIGALAKEFGIRVRLATLDSRCSGMIVRNADVYTVRVNRREAFCRQRYTLWRTSFCTETCFPRGAGSISTLWIAHHSLTRRHPPPPRYPGPFCCRWKRLKRDWAEAGCPTDQRGPAALADRWKVCGPVLVTWPFDEPC